jgi:hypothetical protein
VVALAGTTEPLDAELTINVAAFLEVVVTVAAAHDAVIVTGATDAGIFHVLGLVLERSAAQPAAVIGVAPSELVAVPGDDASDGRVPLEEHHTAIVLVPGDEWGMETPALSRVVDVIGGDLPAVALLIGGGEVARAELDEHLSRGRRVFALRGSGRLADEVARGDPVDDPELSAHVKAGAVTIIDVADGSSQAGRLLDEALGASKARPLRDRVPVLAVWPRFRLEPTPPPPPLGNDATRRFPSLSQGIDDAQRVVYPAFAACDVAAAREQNRYRWFLVLAIIGGLLTTVFGALQAWLHSTPWPGVLVATLGAATSAVTTIARRQGSLDAFLAARVRAERLRSLYFEYLAEPPPRDDRARELRTRRLEARVAEIRFGSVK